MSEPKVNQSLNPLVDNSQVNIILPILKDIFGKVLGVSSAEVDVQTNFFELGLESLLLLQLKGPIQDKFGIDISFRLLLESCSTLNELAIYIAQQIPPKVIKALKVESSPQKSLPPALPLEELTPQQISVEPLDRQLSSSGQKRTLSPEHISGQTTANSDIKRLIAQQLQVMSKQLELLRNSSSAKKKISASLESKQSAYLPQVGQQHAEASAYSSVTQMSVGQSKTQPTNGKIEPKPFVASQKTYKGTSGGLSPRQQKHLDSLIARVIKRTQESKRLTQDARSYHANPRSITGFRLPIKEMLYPIHAQRGTGARIWDVDGNEYIDLSMGFGPLLFGHSPSFVIEAIQEYIQRGIQNGPQSRLTGKVAKLFCELTDQERVTFCNDGTEAVMGAIRIARATTGRSKIAMFAGSYHGNLDEVLVTGVPAEDGRLSTVPQAPGIAQHISEKVIVLNYGSHESLDVMRGHAHELAAVLVEPVQSRRPDLQPKEFLYELRQLTQETGIVLIFDEVITGFRMHSGGVQALWDIQADITTYGKAFGSGLPVGAVAGKAAFMDVLDGGFWSYGDASVPQRDRTYFAGTFFKNPLVMSVVWAVLNHLKNSGTKLQEDLAEKTTKLANTLNCHFEQKQLPIRVVNFGSLFRFTYPSNLAWINLLFYHLLEKGIYIWEGHVCFLSTAHTEEDIAQFIWAVKESIVEMQEGGFLPPDPISTSIDGSISHQASGSLNNQTSLNQTLSAPPIHPVYRNGALLPMSFDQERLWFLDQLESGSSAYNLPGAIRLKGLLNIAALVQSFNEIVRRHEALRTNFGTVDGQPVQVIAPTLTLTLPISDLRELPEVERETEVQRLATEEAQQPFDLSKDPLLRLTLLQLDEADYVLLFTVHHIISDTWSIGVICQELAVLYEAFSTGKPSPLPELPIQFADFAVWQRQWLQGKVLEKQLSYWKRQLDGAPTLLKLPTDIPRPTVQNFQGARQTLVLSQTLSASLKALSRHERVTLFMTLMAAFKTLLHCYIGQDDIVVGSPIANRNPAETQGLIGLFINTLVLRTDLSGNPSFREVLKRERDVVLGAYDHQDIPLGQLIKELQPERNLSHNPLFQVWFVLENIPMSALELPNLTLSTLDVYNGTARFDLLLQLSETPEGLIGFFEYKTDLFNTTSINRMAQLFELLLHKLAEQPDAQLSNLKQMLAEAKKQQQFAKEKEFKQTRSQKLGNVRRSSISGTQLERVN